jgi:hypothetical protein
MREEEMDSDDNLRLHYDLDELEIVKLGPGWSKSPSGSRAREVEERRQRSATLPIVGKLSEPN